MMARPRLRVADYVQHMLDAIERIETNAAGLTRETFLETPLVNLSTVWTTVQRDLPALKVQLVAVRAALRPSS